MTAMDEAHAVRIMSPSRTTILFLKRMRTFSSPRIMDDRPVSRSLHVTLSRGVYAARSALRLPSGVQRPICLRIGEHDLEQFPEKPVDARIARTARLCPGGGFRQRQLVPTVDGKEVENARLVPPDTGLAVARRIRAKVGGGIED